MSLPLPFLGGMDPYTFFQMLTLGAKLFSLPGDIQTAQQAASETEAHQNRAIGRAYENADRFRSGVNSFLSSAFGSLLGGVPGVSNPFSEAGLDKQVGGPPPRTFSGTTDEAWWKRAAQWAKEHPDQALDERQIAEHGPPPSDYAYLLDRPVQQQAYYAHVGYDPSKVSGSSKQTADGQPTADQSASGQSASGQSGASQDGLIEQWRKRSLDRYRGLFEHHFAPGNSFVEQVGKFGDQYRQDIRSALDESGLTAAKDAATQRLSDISDIHRGAEDTRSQLRSDYADWRQLMDPQRFLDQQQEILDTIKNVRGAWNIASANAPVAAQKASELAQLEANKANIIATQGYAAYEALRRDIIRRADNQMAANARAERERTDQLYADTATQLQRNLSEFGSAFAAGSASFAQAFMGTYEQEANTVSTIINDAVQAGQAWSKPLTDAAGQIFDTLWSAAQEDEKIWSLTMVDGPNAVDQLATTAASNIQMNLTNLGFNAAAVGSQLEDVGIQLDYNFTPAAVMIGPFLDGILGPLLDINAQRLQRHSIDAQERANDRGLALGAASLGIQTFDVFAGHQGLPGLSGKSGGGGGDSTT